MSKEEAVEHPEHYGGKDDPYEAIKVMEAWSSAWINELRVPYAWRAKLVIHGVQVLKYMRRFARKGSPLENLRKGRFYLDRMIGLLESSPAGKHVPEVSEPPCFWGLCDEPALVDQGKPYCASHRLKYEDPAERAAASYAMEIEAEDQRTTEPYTVLSRNRLLHTLWTKAATARAEDYDKQQWLQLERELFAPNPLEEELVKARAELDEIKEVLRKDRVVVHGVQPGWRLGTALVLLKAIRNNGNVAGNQQALDQLIVALEGNAQAAIAEAENQVAISKLVGGGRQSSGNDPTCLICGSCESGWVRRTSQRRPGEVHCRACETIGPGTTGTPLERRGQTAHQARIERLMHGFDQAVPDKPTLPDETVRVLRARLIMEEALETIQDGLRVEVTTYKHKFRSDDVEPVELDFDELSFEAKDGPADLVELADGCADVSVVTIGTLSAFGIKDKPLLEEVDHNNLAKLEGGPVVDEHGKGQKPEGHKGPDVAGVLVKQDWVPSPPGRPVETAPGAEFEPQF